MQLTEITTDPRPVAVARIGLGIALIVNTVEMFTILSGVAHGMVALPVHDAIPAPTETAVVVHTVLVVAAGAAVAAGWRTTGAAVISTALNVWMLLWDQQMHSAPRMLITLLVAYLIFARSDSAWSVSQRGGRVPWWPQLLMMTQVSICYFFGAVSKVNFAFLSGAPLFHWVWVPFPWWAFLLMAVGTVVVELFIAFGLWFQRTRLAAACLGVALHTSIMAMLAGDKWVLFAFAVACLCTYPVFLARPPVAGARHRVRAQELTA